MNTNHLAVQCATKEQLATVVAAINAEAARLSANPRHLVVAARIDAEGELVAVDVREDVSRGAAWSYDGAWEWLDLVGVPAAQARVAELEAVAYSNVVGAAEAHRELVDEALPALEAAVESVSHVGRVNFFTQRPLVRTSRLVVVDGVRMWADAACGKWEKMAKDVADVLAGRPTAMYGEALQYLAHGHIRVIDGVPMDILAGLAEEVENAG